MKMLTGLDYELSIINIWRYLLKEQNGNRIFKRMGKKIISEDIKYENNKET